MQCTSHCQHERKRIPWGAICTVCHLCRVCGIGQIVCVLWLTSQANCQGCTKVMTSELSKSSFSKHNFSQAQSIEHCNHLVMCDVIFIQFGASDQIMAMLLIVVMLIDASKLLLQGSGAKMSCLTHLCPFCFCRSFGTGDVSMVKEETIFFLQRILEVFQTC